MKNIKTISIIGGNGKMGQLFAREFRKMGIEVIIAGRNTKISYEYAAKKGDVIIITVPIRNTREVIEKVAPFVRKEALLTDFTSVKIMPCQAMKKLSKSEVVGGHPVFGPESELKGQPFVVCPISGKGMQEEYFKILRKIGLNVILMSPEEHDKKMAAIQCLTHISNFAYGTALKKIGFDIKDAEVLASPAFKLRVSALMKPLKQDPKLYADIETENPYAEEMIESYKSAVSDLEKSIVTKDKKRIEELIDELKKYFNGN